MHFSISHPVAVSPTVYTCCSVNDMCSGPLSVHCYLEAADLKYVSQDALGSILRDFPLAVVGLLLSCTLILATHTVLIRPGNVSQQHWPTAHFLYRHLQTFSPAPMTDFMAFLSAEPLMPSWVYVPPSKQLAKPLHPAWMGMQNIFLLPLALIYQFFVQDTTCCCICFL